MVFRKFRKMFLKYLFIVSLRQWRWEREKRSGCLGFLEMCSKVVGGEEMSLPRQTSDYYTDPSQM